MSRQAFFKSILIRTGEMTNAQLLMRSTSAGVSLKEPKHVIEVAFPSIELALTETQQIKKLQLRVIGTGSYSLSVTAFLEKFAPTTKESTTSDLNLSSLPKDIAATRVLSIGRAKASILARAKDLRIFQQVAPTIRQLADRVQITSPLDGGTIIDTSGRLKEATKKQRIVSPRHIGNTVTLASFGQLDGGLWGLPELGSRYPHLGFKITITGTPTGTLDEITLLIDQHDLTQVSDADNWLG